MEILATTTVADLVTKNIKTADVFKKHGIDFCCGGGISLEKACKKANIEFPQLERELLSVENNITRENDYNSWSLSFLADHIVNVHHQYIEESTPLLKQYADRVEKVHGNDNPDLRIINNLVKKVGGEMAAHCKKEELILFPFIKKLEKAKKEAADKPNANFGTVDNPIKMMEVEHEEAGEIMKTISKLTNNFTPPQGACNTYRAFFAKLAEYEKDLHQHVHLENNILFPKALKLESEL